MLIKKLSNIVFRDVNIGCYDCRELATVIIEMKESDIYLCKDCLEKLKKLK
jgi:predicted nucleic acid-binding Zn ribbon protein